MPTNLDTNKQPDPPRWSLRLMWFVILWLGGLGAVSALAYVLRLWIAPR